MKKFLFALLLLTVLATVVNADWLTIPIGRIRVAGFFQPLTNDMMGWLSAAGNARVDAEERLSIAMQDYCTLMPDKCVALGITVNPN